MFNHAREIGVKMHLGQEINRVWEGKSSCGIIIDGKKLHADCIISCDGVHSATRSSIINHSPTPRASGYAAYRALIEGKSIAEDPEARWILEGSESRDKFEVFFVGDTQLFLQTANKGAEVIWLCFHKDSRPVVDESNTPANPNDVLNIIKDWPVAQKLWAVIRHTPSHKFIDYPFFDRDPLPTWRSQKGRMMLAGDAAHYFSPGGGQGASQALEDANVIATCLRIAGRDNVPVALQIAENIRHPRATAVQLLGHRATEAWQKQNIGYAEEGCANIAKFPLHDWVYRYDSQSHCEAEFDVVMEAIRTGRAYIPKDVDGMHGEEPKACRL
ncbi:hypothetical protein AbraIFM66951_005467 [Aspergillus brasiliensis]|uniref:FAD-binding domain-containing protein n=1 Tax=Aspergillus brasiliensis TaxID=319629 RepID=A0A9W5Z4I9_9EURO|nr:hypothetical protein AbraCBS73388_004866 [Aspergillus brasiliensis]GKZ51320.1 hypothetical protein AbraIFM66951_005467 [Aspergillus brasiliensis]